MWASYIIIFVSHGQYVIYDYVSVLLLLFYYAITEDYDYAITEDFYLMFEEKN